MRYCKHRRRSFGEPAPASELFAYFGFTVGDIVKAVLRAVIACRNSTPTD
jgi:transketolase